MTTKILPSAERVRELLHYEPSTGVFTRRVDVTYNARAGDVAGCPDAYGYFLINIDGRLYKAHRLAWLHTHGVWPKEQIDHRDGDPSNNRLSNLREASQAENMQNQRRPRPDNSSGYLGAGWHKAAKKWRARIEVNGKSHHLGLFATAEEAHAAYLRAKHVLHPFNTLMVDK